NKLQQLKIDRQDLLSRYKPDAQPVRDMDQKIAALQGVAAPNPDAGAKRMGVNPIYQTLETERNQLQAQAASLRDRQAAVIAGLQQVTSRRQKLTELEPRYQDLARERDVLSGNVRAFIVREQEGQAAQAVAKTGEDNVRVIERAYPPVRGSSLKKPVMIVAVLFAAFAALCVGLLRAFLSRGFPTVAAVERAVELPVLVRAPLKHSVA
ncbi:MAG: lipopolysaccharide biosynthesis protein, partial [Caulobacteraceae bacterium]